MNHPLPTRPVTGPGESTTYSIGHLPTSQSQPRIHQQNQPYIPQPPSQPQHLANTVTAALSSTPTYSGAYSQQQNYGNYGGYNPLAAAALFSPYQYQQMAHPHHQQLHTQSSYFSNSSPTLVNSQGYTISSSYRPQLCNTNSAQDASSSIAYNGTNNVNVSNDVKKIKRQPLNVNLAISNPIMPCSMKACNFIAKGKKELIEHEMDRHLIYPPGWKEKKSRDGPAGPVQIAGTSVSLQSPEEISAWIAERKRKFPTAAKVEEKVKAKEEALARGEVDFDDKRRKRKRSEEEGGKSARGGRNRGRGRGRGSDRNSFTSRRGFLHAQYQPQDSGYSNGSSNCNTAPKYLDDTGAKLESFSDSDASSAGSIYSSSSSSDSDLDDVQLSDKTDDDDGPEQQSSKPPIPPVVLPPSPLPAPASTHNEEKFQVYDLERKRKLCVHFKSRGGCRKGDRCGFVHDPDAPAQTKLKGPKQTVQPPPPKSLLLSLLSVEIEHSTSNISQVMKFLVENDFLRGVETRIGAAKEREEIRTRIQVVQGFQTQLADRAESVEYEAPVYGDQEEEEAKDQNMGLPDVEKVEKIGVEDT